MRTQQASQAAAAQLLDYPLLVSESMLAQGLSNLGDSRRMERLMWKLLNGGGSCALSCHLFLVGRKAFSACWKLLHLRLTPLAGSVALRRRPCHMHDQDLVMAVGMSQQGELTFAGASHRQGSTQALVSCTLLFARAGRGRPGHGTSASM